MTGIIRWYVVHPEVKITTKFGGEQASAHRERPDLRVTDHAVQQGVFIPSIDALAYMAHKQNDRHY